MVHKPSLEPLSEYRCEHGTITVLKDSVKIMPTKATIRLQVTDSWFDQWHLIQEAAKRTFGDYDIEVEGRQVTLTLSGKKDARQVITRAGFMLGFLREITSDDREAKRAAERLQRASTRS